MTGGELLSQLLTLFSQEISQADFRPGYAPEAASRLPDRPVVAGEVDAETVKPSSQEIRLKFSIFLPPAQSPALAEDLFTRMCALAREEYDGFSAVSRGSVIRDAVTGLLEVPCTLTFLREDSSGGGGAAVEVVVGGRALTATSVKTSFASHGVDLIAVGEEEPFARTAQPTEYTVELDGVETVGLERLAAFTAQVGEAEYAACRWKTLAPGKAVFTSTRRELTGGEGL